MDPSASTLDRQKHLIRRQANKQILLPEQSLLEQKTDEDIMMDVGAEVDIMDVDQYTQDIPLKQATTSTQTNTVILQDAATDPLFLYSDQSTFSCHNFIHNSKSHSSLYRTGGLRQILFHFVNFRFCCL